MNKTYYVCKYTPVELLAALGAECENLNSMPEGFELAEQVVHPNLCGFGKAVLEAVLEGQVRELVLVNCCDTIRSVYDILEDSGQMDFLYMVDMLRSDGACSRERTALQLKSLAKAYAAYKGTSFDLQKFRQAFQPPQTLTGPHIAVCGARMGKELFEMAEQAMPYPVENDSCVNNRSVGAELPPQTEDFDALMDWYAGELLRQLPCMRMTDNTGRKQLYNRPGLRGIIYHTVKFCDFYSFEYAELKTHAAVPLLKIESDYTVQSSGQLMTRLEAFAESLEASMTREHKKPGNARTFENNRILKGLNISESAEMPEGSVGSNGIGLSAGAKVLKSVGDEKNIGEGKNTGKRQASKVTDFEAGKERSMAKRYFAGIDSGSTSTDVVILDSSLQMAAGIILPTGAGAAAGAERALEAALEQAGLSREDIAACVTTGYGRTAIQIGDKSITEITCHARGAHFLDPEVRTVIDIGGQDSKVIRLDESGAVANFVMNDKCAAGTGRFLEMMARTMEVSLDELADMGLDYKEDITISSMCTVFAESEVVSLVAQNKAVDDIVHGLNKAVAAKTAALVKRVGGQEKYMMTGGVSKNKGLVKTLEERLGTKLVISEQAQLCGALGAALFAAEMQE